MNKRTFGAALAGAVLLAGASKGAVALAQSDDGDNGVTGADADRAAAAALAETHEVKANAVERDSEKGAVWEVEVAKADGSVVDVRLDGDFHVVLVERDSEGG